jgi:hypothetical protein
VAWRYGRWHVVSMGRGCMTSQIADCRSHSMVCDMALGRPDDPKGRCSRRVPIRRRCLGLVSSAASLLSADTVSQSSLRAADCFWRSRITALQRGNAVDWQTVSATVDAQGRTSLPALVTKDGEANYVATMYTQDSVIRSGIVMERHGFGRGKYRYFDCPLPTLRICRWRPVKSAT